MNKKMIAVLALSVCVATFAFAADLRLEDVIKNIQSNQTKLKDVYMESTTTVTSNISMPGARSKGPQKMVQKAKMWSKGENKGRLETISPMKQTTITNGDKMVMINEETGQKVVQDLKKMRQKNDLPEQQTNGVSLEKLKQYFNLSVRKQDNFYVITGVPRQTNKLISKLEFYVDTDKWVPAKILMYNQKGALMSQSDIEYQKISDIWVPVRNVSNMSTPGGEMKVVIEFSNIRVNKGIGDEEFKVGD